MKIRELTILENILLQNVENLTNTLKQTRERKEKQKVLKDKLFWENQAYKKGLEDIIAYLKDEGDFYELKAIDTIISNYNLDYAKEKIE